MAFLYKCLIAQCLIWHFGMANFSLKNKGVTEEVTLKMPNVTVTHDEPYICTGLNVQNDSFDIIGFHSKPGHYAHHILVTLCDQPVNEGDHWSCKHGTPGCTMIIFAWVHGQQDLDIPMGGGFRVGKRSNIKYVRMQVHYKKVPGQGIQDSSAMILRFTRETLPLNAGVVYIHNEDGYVLPGTTANFEAACEITNEVEMHPVYLSAHTHGIGKAATAWKVSPNNTWELIAKANPRHYEPLFLVTQIVLRKGDTIATRCAAVNNGTTTVHLGRNTGNAMCNFFLGYWVLGDELGKPIECEEKGAPFFSWANNTNLKNIPDVEASSF